MSGSDSAGPSGDGNVISQNYVTDLPGIAGNPYSGYGIIVGNDIYGSIADNKLAAVSTGIEVWEQIFADASGDSVAVTGNTVSASSAGIYFNLSYHNATVSGNTISLDTTLPAGSNNVGLDLQSLEGGSTTVQNNNVSGFQYGVEMWNLTTSSTVMLQGGTLSGNNYGVLVTNNDPSFGPGAAETVAISGVTIQNSSIAGVLVQDSPSGSAAVAATIEGGTSVTGSPTGILVSGAHASATISGNDGSIYGNVIGIDLEGGSATVSGNHIYGNTTGIKLGAGTATISSNNFAGATDNTTDLLVAGGTLTALTGNTFAGTTYINNQTSQAIDATSDTFAGQLGSAMSNGQAWTAEDKITDYLDNASYGFVRLATGEVWVTQLSDSIQRGINAANTIETSVPANGDAVNVQAGTYHERLTIGKSVTLLGAQAGIDPTQTGARTNPANESIVDLDGLGISNPNVLVTVSSGVNNVTIDGFTLNGSPTYHYADEDVIEALGNNNNLTASNNVMSGYYGLVFKGGSGLVADSNRITANEKGITLQGGTPTNVTLTGNTLTPGTAPAADDGPIYMTGVTGGLVSGNVGNGFPGYAGLSGSNNSGTDAAHPLLISGNTFSGDQKGISLWGATQFVSITGNTLTSNTSNGIEIKGAHLTISGNTIAGNATGIYLDKNSINTTDVSISGNDFRGTTAGTADNGTDLTITAAVTDFTIGNNNHFAGDGYYINNLNAQNIDLTVTSGTTYGAYDPAVLTDNFRIEDRMYHKVDNAASGLITWVADNVYVTAPTTHSTGTTDTDSSIQQGINAVPTPSTGWTVNVEAGTYNLSAGLNINKSLSLVGPNAGVSGGGSRVAEAILNGGASGTPNGGGASINIGGGSPLSLTVEGLEFTNFDTWHILYEGGGTPITSAVVADNVFTGNNGGIFTKYNTSLASEFDVTGNLISNQTMSGGVNTALFFLGNVANSHFDDNQVQNGPRASCSTPTMP